MAGKTRPLAGRTILITRSQTQAPEFRKLLEGSGARVLEIPTIEIRPRPAQELEYVIRAIERYDWLIFTSANGAEIFLKRLRQAGAGKPTPRVCAIGPGTAQKVKQFGYRVDFVPQVYQAEGVLEGFLQFHGNRLGGLRILIPRASRAREILPEVLRQRGADVVVLPVYDTVIPETSRIEMRDALEKEAPDLITFTSSSTVENFLALAQDVDVRRFRYAAIGPITAAAARERGLNVVLQAPQSTVPALVKAVEDFFRTAR